MINLRINTIIRLTNFTTALAWELYKHKVKKLFQKSEKTFGSGGVGPRLARKKIIIGKIVSK